MSDVSNMTDQSIQVDFPIVVRNAMIAKRLRKHHTTEAFNLPNRSLQNSWVQLRPTLSRPKSLNLSTEAFHRSKISFLSESPISRNNNGSNSSVSLQNISREKTPPMGSPDINSTLVLSQFKSYPPKLSGSGMHTPTSPPPKTSLPPQYLTVNNNNNNNNGYTADTSLESMTSVASCRCLCEDEYASNQRFVTGSTPEGLSWRRLHMSRAKLKATATTSELLSGFAMVAMVELQINEPTNVPEWLFVMFAICTTVLVSVHIFALMISTYILPNIDAISKLDICELVSESPHERMRGFIELAWAFSTVLGLFLFLVEVAILCWVKFWDYSFNAAIAATVVVIPVLVIFILFVVHFYHSLVVYKCDTSRTDMQKLEDMRKQLDSVQNPV